MAEIITSYLRIQIVISRELRETSETVAPNQKSAYRSVMKWPHNQSCSQRNNVEHLLGKRLAKWLGPYPDEVGWFLSVLLFVFKILLLITVFWILVDLALTKELGDRLAMSLVVFGLTAIFLGWSMPSDSK